ncbi:hypothetical protein [Arabiibacter massiliensis]|uniref:hypothetical protein n=1 Tax=Arabiibacter massiliensis TaxID=1870985 RepID=UPI0009BA597B|nr:hypothetical protein [Arabiibacter massiliensis]
MLVSDTIVASNKVCADQGMDGLAYAWAELEFGGDALLAVEEPEPEAAPAPPACDVDYAVWGVELADGAVREFDSAAGRFLA